MLIAGRGHTYTHVQAQHSEACFCHADWSCTGFWPGKVGHASPTASSWKRVGSRTTSSVKRPAVGTPVGTLQLPAHCWPAPVIDELDGLSVQGEGAPLPILMEEKLHCAPI